MVDWLRQEMQLATVADLQRAAQFLEFARAVRKGCDKQRAKARRVQSQGWKKHVDPTLRW